MSSCHGGTYRCGIMGWLVENVLVVVGRGFAAAGPGVGTRSFIGFFAASEGCSGFPDEGGGETFLLPELRL